ncbi:MAG: NtrZ family periplasmic regulatory protein [Alphaproteobacteria bacterium]
MRHAIIGIGVVVAAGAGVAQAEETRAAHALKAADEAPWFERFTASTAGEAVRSAPLSERSMTWAPSARWGVTLNLKDTDRTKTQATRDETALGAFYDFTPRLRLGGEVRVADPTATTGGPGAKNNNNPDATAGVKLESAFRF